MLISFTLAGEARSVAEDAPAAVLKKVVSLIQREGDPSPVVDFVYWDKVYAKLPAKNKAVMNIKNPKDLKEFYRKVLKSPAAELENVLRPKMEASLGVEKTNAMLDTLKAKAQQKEKELKRRIKGTEYIVGPSKISGDRAQVPLTFVYKKQKKTENVSLIKVKNAWLLEDLGKGLSFREPEKKRSKKSKHQ